MSKNLLALLDQAAQLRSGGASWEAVARKVNRKPSTCRAWPRRHPHIWQPLYQEAAAARSLELGNEAEMTLRHLLRDEDKRWQIKSAEVLMRHRWQPQMNERLFVNSSEWIASAERGEVKTGNVQPVERWEPAWWNELHHIHSRAIEKFHEEHGLPKIVTLKQLQDELMNYFEWEQAMEDHPEQKEAHDAEWLSKYHEIRRANPGCFDTEEVTAEPDNRVADTRVGTVSLGLLALVTLGALALGGAMAKLSHDRAAVSVVEDITRKNGDTFKTRSASLASQNWNLIGQLDLVEEKGGHVYPIEYKRSHAPEDAEGRVIFYENDALQLYGQALLLKAESGIAVEQGKLYPTNIAQRIAIMNNARNMIRYSGHYSNRDSMEGLAGDRDPTRDIPLAFPSSVEATDNYIYVADMVNLRLLDSGELQGGTNVAMHKLCEKKSAK